MENRVTICAEIDYTFEGYQLFRGLLLERTLEEFKEAVLVKYGMDSEYNRAFFPLLEQIEADAVETFADEMDQVKKYFQDFLPETPLADFVMCREVDAENSCATVMGLKKHYEELSALEKDAFFYKEMVRDMEPDFFWKVIGCEERGIMVSEAERMRNIFREIRSLDISLEMKAQLEEIYLNRESCFEEITDMLERSVSVIKKYEDQIQKFCKTWEAYWTKIVRGKRLEAVMERFNVKLDRGQEELYMLPSVIQCAAIFLTIDGGLIPRKKPLIPSWQIGLLITEDFGPGKEMQEEFEAEELQKSLKALSDKSKYDILLYVKERPAYGSEIAQHFSLTTATVSHHMNRLLGLGLISVEQKEGRVYYKTDKEAMQKLFDACKTIFC